MLAVVEKFKDPSQFLYNASHSFKDTFVRCEVKETTVPCEDIFKRIRTDAGKAVISSSINSKI